MSERDAGPSGYPRRRPPPEWVEETGDSVFPHEDRYAPGDAHDGRTEPDHDAGWDHPTRPDQGPYGYRPGDEHRTLVQPGRYP